MTFFVSPEIDAEVIKARAVDRFRGFDPAEAKAAFERNKSHVYIASETDKRGFQALSVYEEARRLQREGKTETVLVGGLRAGKTALNAHWVKCLREGDPVKACPFCRADQPSPRLSTRAVVARHRPPVRRPSKINHRSCSFLLHGDSFRERVSLLVGSAALTANKENEDGHHRAERHAERPPG